MTMIMIVIKLKDSGFLRNVQVILQHGQRYVEIPMNGTAISPGYEHWFGYSTRGFRITDSSLKDLSSDLRRCRMFSEEPLQFFPVYGRLVFGHFYR